MVLPSGLATAEDAKRPLELWLELPLSYPTTTSHFPRDRVKDPASRRVFDVEPRAVNSNVQPSSPFSTKHPLFQFGRRLELSPYSLFILEDT